MNTDSLQQIGLKLPPGSTLVLQISLRNRTGEAMLQRPTLDDWTANGDLVLAANQGLEPPYIYLFSGGDAHQKMTIPIPGESLPGQNLKTWLRFPGTAEEAIPIEFEIIPAGEPQVVEWPLSVTFPLGGEGNSYFSHSFDSTTAGILGLISGVIDLDKIHTRWLAAELLVLIAQKGEEWARTLLGSKLLEGLKRTTFFKNGALALTLAKLPGWISESLAFSNSYLGGSTQTPGNQRLLYIWEQWLLSLVETDVETGEIGKEIFVPPFLAEAAVAEMGVDGDRWFGDLLLGLAALSPRIGKILEAIADAATTAPVADAKAGEAGYILATALPGYNYLPVRWLVVELLVVLAQVGKESAGSKNGRELSDRLSRTRFFKNGVVALASAKIPRWLQISQSAAAAFATSIGAETGMGGILVFWERWLWSLLPVNSYLGIGENPPHPPFEGGGIRESQPLVPDNSAREALTAELGGNGDLWFEAIVLGLAVVSPRVAAILEAIAALAPAPPSRPAPPQVSGDDILSESKSLGR